MTRGDLKIIIKENLRESGITAGRFQDLEIDTIIQNGYNDIAMRARCIVKNTTLAFEDNLVYYDFLGMGVDDYMGYIGIYNNNSNRWLNDNLSLRDLDKIRFDWESWTGQPEFVVSHSLKYTVVLPYLIQGSGTYELVYWASAPILTSDSDVITIAPDMETLLEDYVCGTLLEDDHEFLKGRVWLQDYEAVLQEYKERCANLAKSDLLRRI